MRPPAKPNSLFYHPLDAILGTEASVRITRMLALRPEAVNAMAIASRCRLGRSGTAKALARLAAAGIVERIKVPRRLFPAHRLVGAHPLADPIRSLFEREAAQGPRPKLFTRRA